ncbi:unnamed protein product [Arabidopsis arenosa]|uniref:NAC domain-containing protein n=1 Tax=Arabidopsis arenosa TaxID=38785 RepID=A0A8S2AK39_ARAAE|nr:unnamed protein product [Arabidopsis arenosa]
MTQYVTRRSQIPGSRFTPSNLELINYLRRKKERGKSSSFIPDMDVYEEVPWLLQHVRHFRSKENEWYYFVTRRNRTVGCFTWRSTTKTSIYKDGVTVGYMRSLAFSLDGMATGWVMHEFLLNRSGKEKVVLCRIRFTLRDDNSQYAPRFESRVIGQPQPPRREEAAREDGLTLVENKKNNLYVGIASGSCPREDVSAQSQQFMRQQNSCFNPNFVENLKAQQQQQYLIHDSNFTVTQKGMIKHQEFGSSGESSGGDLAQNHLLVVPLETQQGMEPQQQENVVENQTTDPSYLTQGQKQQHCEQATDLPINQGTDEPHRSTTSSFSHNELIQQSLGEMDKMANFEKWAQQDLGDMDDMANFGNAEWAQQLGENTPEEEAELQAELGNCKTTASLFNYFCPM